MLRPAGKSIHRVPAPPQPGPGSGFSCQRTPWDPTAVPKSVAKILAASRNPTPPHGRPQAPEALRVRVEAPASRGDFRRPGSISHKTRKAPRPPASLRELREPSAASGNLPLRAARPGKNRETPAARRKARQAAGAFRETPQDSPNRGNLQRLTPKMLPTPQSCHNVCKRNRNAGIFRVPPQSSPSRGRFPKLAGDLPAGRETSPERRKAPRAAGKLDGAWENLHAPWRFPNFNRILPSRS